MKTILTPVDFSDITAAVVAEAATLARALDARIVLFTVIQPPVFVAEYAPLMQNVAEFSAAGEKNAQRQLEKLQAKLTAQSITAETSYEVGFPSTVILEQAKKESADYIVMGSHGHTAFYDLLVGSTTHGILLRSTCPVIIVPAVKKPKAKSARKA
jgi:nucleotide-binding universal stress UspA family protein